MRHRALALAAIVGLLSLPAGAAVDTATKRFNVINMAGSALPVPDGTIDAADRVHLLMAYGPLADAPPTPANPGEGNGSHRMGIKGSRIGL